MKKLWFVGLALLGLVCLWGCINNSSIKEKHDNEIDSLINDSIHGIYASDTIDAYAELVPSDSANGIYYYHGVEGCKLKRRFATDSSKIYVDYRITILDVHADITKSLFYSTHDILLMWGVVAKGDSIAPFNDNEKMSYKDIFKTGLAWSEDCYRSNLNELYQDAEDLFGYYIEISIYPVWLTNNIVTYCIKEESFTGGAHSNYDYYLKSFDRQTGRALCEEDIIKKEKTSKITALIVRHRAAFRDFATVNDYLDDLNEWKNGLFLVEHGVEKRYTPQTFPLGRVGLREEGLVVSYPRYSIAAGVEAVPTVVLAYEEIGDCLKISVKK